MKQSKHILITKKLPLVAYVLATNAGEIVSKRMSIGKVEFTIKLNEWIATDLIDADVENLLHVEPNSYCEAFRTINKIVKEERLKFTDESLEMNGRLTNAFTDKVVQNEQRRIKKNRV